MDEQREYEVVIRTITERTYTIKANSVNEAVKLVDVDDYDDEEYTEEIFVDGNEYYEEEDDDEDDEVD